jgi:NDP-sugar pyrophosphorylase family protein
MQAIILAGGKGKRFQPYSLVLPKPLIPIKDKPIMEIIIRQLARFGITDITISTGYLSELIEAYFGDGSRFGVRIIYSKEDVPLGTIGPLTLLDNLDDSFFVLNGDTLTDMNFLDLLNSHNKSGSPLTIASFPKPVKIDLGVLELDEKKRLIDYVEKPELKYRVSMGIYVLNKSVLSRLTPGQYFDFPSLVKMLIAANAGINVYEFSGIWHDLGSIDNYEIALKDVDRVM